MAITPSDPRFGNQWHLRNTAASQLDVNVEDVGYDLHLNAADLLTLDIYKVNGPTIPSPRDG